MFNITSANKKIEYIDDFGLDPTRARFMAGKTVTFTNKTTLPQAMEARDGSWTTGLIQPGSSASVTVTKPGEYEFVSQDHPWVIGQLIVEATDAGSHAAAITVAAGIYTREQAQRGMAAYKQSCAACHLEDLSGSDRNPALAGSGFVANWTDKSVADLYNRTRLTMPQSSPGSLPPQTYIDIVAFLLQANGFPASDTELEPNAGLAHIAIKTK